jgi:molecular chaperone GrpE
VTEPNNSPLNEPAPSESAPAAEGQAPDSEGNRAAAASNETREELAAKVSQLAAQLEDSTARARETAQRLKDEHDRLLRTAAEFDNFKKRAGKEKDDTRKYAVESLLKDFLPVADNLERALDHAEQHDPKQVIDGVRLVQKMLEGALSKHGVIGFSALGQMFDPAQHEALMQADSDQPAGTVIQEMARGYKLAERLVRPAAVVVARAREVGATPGTASATAASEVEAKPN